MFAGESSPRACDQSATEKEKKTMNKIMIRAGSKMNPSIRNPSICANLPITPRR
jgi:hypothetical protein